MRAERAAEAAQDYDVRDLMDGATLLASTANVVMQLAQPQVGADLPVPVQRLPG